MNTRILNRDFQHPADGWYQIEVKGTHPNARANIIQIVDNEACSSIVNNFNRESAKPDFAGMLIDIDHLKHDETKETRAYGWLTKLENRADGIFGQIRWTGTGQLAVDRGDYRFFSTEYRIADMQVLNKGESPKQLRPLKLAGLTLTNVNNNKGQKPITNRMKNNNDNSDVTDDEKSAALAASKKANDASKNADSAPQHEKAAVLQRKAQKLNADCGKDDTAEYHGDMAEHHDDTADAMRNGVKNRQFPTAPGSTERQNTTDTEPMKKLFKELGLAEDASEDVAVAAVKTIKNRATELESAQIDADLETYKNRFDPKQRDFIKNLLVTNRAGTLDFLKAQPERKEATSPERVHNRGAAGNAEADANGATAADAQAKIEQAITSLRASDSKLTYSRARDLVRNRQPELFGLKKK